MFRETRKSIIKSGRIYRTQLRREMRRRGKIASRETYNSILPKVGFDGRNLFLDVIGSIVLIYIEKGRKPGKFPPPDSMRKYIETKGIKPREPNMSKSTLGFLIGRKIAKDGIKPVKILTDTESKVNDKIFDLYRDGLGKDYDELIFTRFNEIYK